MGRRHSDQDRDLHAVWEQIPTVACRGLCAHACGPIDASAREKQRLRRRGVRLLPRAQALRELAETGSYRCPALTAEDRCSVYEDRPTVCRLWGAQQAMPCPHGCQRDGDVTGLQLLAQACPPEATPAGRRPAAHLRGHRAGDVKRPAAGRGPAPAGP